VSRRAATVASAAKPARASRRRPSIIESRVAEHPSGIVARAFNAAFEDYLVRLS